uniref:Ovule protein n=1 Tax=Ascaris lumbricoides TaxID=6252 RepID=A0A0M3HRA5_ASCLU
MQTLFSDSVLKCSRASLYLSALSVVDEIDQKNFICQPLLSLQTARLIFVQDSACGSSVNYSQCDHFIFAHFHYQLI